MIRKLMASSAIAALMTAGTFSVAVAQTDPTQNQDPAVVQQDQQQMMQTPAAGQQHKQTMDTMAAGDKSKLTPERPTLATAFIGRDVYSSEDPESDNIGEVNDLIVNDDGTITHAVIGVGGFLGIGEKDVAVPFGELEVVERDGDIRLVYAATREQLESAEELDRTAYDPGARFAEEQAAMQPAAGAGAPAGAMSPAPTGDIAAAPAGATDLTPAQEPEAAGANVHAPNTQPDTAIVAETTAPAQQDMTADATVTTAEAQKPAPATDQTADAGQTAAGEPGFLSFSADQVRASTLMGKEIYGPDDESIGEVSDLVLREDGKTRAALIDVGGFLGVGEKEIAIPFEQIQVQPSQDPAGEPRLTIAMTREELDQLPAFQDNTMGSGQAATTQPADPNKAADSTKQPADQNMAADSTKQNVAADTTAQPATQQASPDVVASNAGRAAQDISAEELLGTAVYGSNDESVGEVGDVIFGQGGEIEAVVIDVGGFLGIGEKPVAVQFDALNVQKDQNGGMTLSLNATQEQLENAPTYDKTAAAQ